jgi:hypothetical protein
MRHYKIKEYQDSKWQCAGPPEQRFVFGYRIELG